MKRYMDLVVYVLYRYYKDGGRRQEVAFQTTKLVLGVCLLLNIFTVLSIFHFNPTSGIVNRGSSGTQYFLTFIFIIIPMYIIMSLLFKEDKIQKLEYSELTRKKASVYVVCYIIFSFILFGVIVKIFH